MVYSSRIPGIDPCLSKPVLKLHCDSTDCDGLEFYEVPNIPEQAVHTEFRFVQLSYTCRNCKKSAKDFFLRVRGRGTPATMGFAIKIAEWPPFGPPLPSRLISLVGPDRDLFMQGCRSEAYGYGIGAFAYYRRVVENQKGRLIEEFQEAAERLGAERELLDSLETAKRETQFSRAIELIKPGIPAQLLIKGQNPLAPLHHATSEELHAGTDQQCLLRAGDVREILEELAHRIVEALKDRARVEEAVKRLMRPAAEE